MDPDYFEKWNYADRSRGTGSMYWFARRYYARLIRRFAPVATSGEVRTVVELGSGLGDLLALLQDDFECTGIEPLGTAVEASRTRAPRATLIHADDKYLAGLADRSVDVFVSMHVFEHLEEPSTALRHVGRILRPGGLGLIVTPNPDYRLRRYKDPADDAIAKDPTHINVHPPAVWAKWCEEAGLTVDRHFGDGLWDVPYVRWVPASLQFAVLGVPALVQVLCTASWTPLPFGVNQILILHASARPSES